ISSPVPNLQNPIVLKLQLCIASCFFFFQLSYITNHFNFEMSGSASLPTNPSKGQQHSTNTQGANTKELLLRQVPNNPETVLSALSTQPELAKQADAFGYTLLHAASSYAQADLAKALVNEYSAPVDAVDEDGETALFYAETVDMAKLLI